jgi:predicted DNA-binding transcriptional regulator YafY
MNKTDRLLAIILELQSKGRQRAEDLAATFETSKRTIYRDIEALCEAGVPLVAIPGQGYSLMHGYFLPPLSFTTEEATMLLLGSDFIAQNVDAQYRQAAQSAMRKIGSVLPEQLRDEVKYLQNNIRLISVGAPHHSTEQAKLQQLRRAIIERTTVRFYYYARHSQQTATLREADPYSLVYIYNSWHLTAYCHLRQEIRNFRFERIEELELLSTNFQRPSNQPTANFLGCRGDGRLLRIRALFAREIMRWVQESRSYYVTDEEETPDGLLVTLTVRREEEVLQWLLSWGRHVRILEPESLRSRLRAEAESMLRNHQDRI